MKQLYSLYDSKAEHYASPVMAPTDAVARRMLAVVVDDPSTELGRHPEDFILFRIGAFNEELGRLTPCEPIAICNAIELRKTATQAIAMATEENA